MNFFFKLAIIAFPKWPINFLEKKSSNNDEDTIAKKNLFGQKKNIPSCSIGGVKLNGDGTSDEYDGSGVFGGDGDRSGDGVLDGTAYSGDGERVISDDVCPLMEVEVAALAAMTVVAVVQTDQMTWTAALQELSAIALY